MALSDKVRTVLRYGFGDIGAAKELADAVDAMTGGNAVLASANAFTGANTFTGGVIVATDGVTVTDVDIALSATTGTKFGTATTQKLAFHNATPVAQRAGAAQVAVATTGSTNTTPYGFTSSAQADAIVALLNEIRAALVEKGIIKGAA